MANPQSESGKAEESYRPLADRMRPQRLEELVGQGHLLAPGKALRRAIEDDQLVSLILWGPPGTGKTTLARLIAHETRSRYFSLSAVTSGVADLRKVIAEAQQGRGAGRPPSISGQTGTRRPLACQSRMSSWSSGEPKAS